MWTLHQSELKLQKQAFEGERRNVTQTRAEMLVDTFTHLDE